MTDADVVYSEVRFTKPTGNAAGPASAQDGTTYTELRLVKTEPTTELPGSQQEEVSNGGSKITPERAAIAVLSALLAAAVIALGFTSHKYIQTTGRLNELTAANKNLTERRCEVETPNKEQKTCPAGVNTTKPCAKCQEGWEQHGTQCYYFSNNTSPWEKARTECQHRGGDLVRVDSTEKQSFLQRNLGDKMNSEEEKFWIGLTDAQTEGTWLWADGSPLSTSLTFWSYREPDDWKKENPDGEDCVRMGGKGRSYINSWFDKSCKVPQRSICEKPADTGNLMCV